MRGEHCVAGASILSAIAIIMLIFANIGQLNTGPVVNGIYMAQVDVAAYGAGWVAVTNISAGGLYDTANDPLGTSKGLRQQYRYGLYNACAYQKDGSGICNSTVFGYPMNGFVDILSDVPPSFKQTTSDLAGDPTLWDIPFKDNGYNYSMSRAGSLLIFVGSLAALGALIFGAIKVRLFFLIAVIFSSASAFLLLIGATLWTALIARDSLINAQTIGGNKAALGFIVSPGASLYLTWVAFALMTLATLPYVVSCCTYRKA